MKVVVNDTFSDPRGTTLVAESILKRGTIKLDDYDQKHLSTYPGQLYKHKGHTYYLFPLGSSIASIPLVAAANAMGMEMTASDSHVQRFMASLVSALMIFFLYRLARVFFTPFNAMLAAALFWFGTSLASTGATALWSHDLATLFALIAIYLAVKDSLSEHSRNWAWIGLCLFLAYFCRPTLSLLSPFLLLFLFARHKLAALKAGLITATLLALFVAFSYHEFGQFLPRYYLPKRVARAPHFSTALYGNLLSPARGLLVFTPFLLAAWLCAKREAETFRLNWLWWGIGLGWPLAHLVVVSRFPHWWAGYSYGPRFMMDVLPGLFLLTLRAWPATLDTTRLKVGATVLALTAVFSVYVHTYQGLYNRYTNRWNSEPSIDRNPQYLFDWKYPQFLHTRSRHEARVREYASPPEPASRP
jgi:Dolichyl-phosphate-mannose-protein mannosyltransferase